MNENKTKPKTAKGKKPIVLKLKSVLENPIKQRCPTLPLEQLDACGRLLQRFVAQGDKGSLKHIRLGLESTLRAIQNGKSACTMLSLSIKPPHIINLIARNSQIKDECAPVFVQPQLEEFTKRIFGIPSMALCLTNELEHVDTDLAKWLGKHKLPKRLKKPLNTLAEKKPTNKNKIPKQPKGNIEKGNEVAKSIASKKEDDVKSTPPNSAEWNDYISFTENKSANDELQSDEDNEMLVKSLSKMKPSLEQQSPAPTKMEIDELPLLPSKVEASCDNDSDCDDFLSEYKTLEVHKINKNPNKKPKKKKKNKNK